MTEYSRKGHWRTLPDGTRTWVSGHDVVREPPVVSHGYDDAVIERRLAPLIERYAAKKARKAARKAAAARRKAERLRKKSAEAERTKE